MVAGSAGRPSQAPPYDETAPEPGLLFPEPEIILPDGWLDPVVVGDFNDDGHADIAAISKGNNLIVLLGSGTGGFTTLPAVTLPRGVTTMLVGDFNEDGRLDLLVGGYGAMLLTGVGDGTFVVGPRLTGWDVFKPSVVGDFNGDGHEDVVTSNYGVQVVFGNGDGTFAPGQFTRLTNNVRQLAAVDLNADGRLDLAVETGLSFVPLFGRGDGTFDLDEWAYANVYTEGDMRVGDWNRDGSPDVAVIGFPQGDPTTAKLWVMTNDGHGVFQEQSFVSTVNLRLLSIDWDGDGHPEVGFYPSGSRDLWMLSWDPEDGLVPRDTGQELSGVEGADFDEDGLVDLLDLPSFAKLGFFYSHIPRGWVTRERPVSTLWADHAVTGDFDGDGKTDIITFGQFGGYQFQRASSDGAYESAPAVPNPTNAYFPLVGDVNEDGRLDLVFGQADYVGPTALLGQGDGSFVLRWQQRAYTTGLVGAALADVDRDGHLDLVTMEQGGSATPIYVYPGRGDGTFGTRRVSSASGSLFRMKLVDVDGDGVLDLVSLDLAARSLAILHGTGQGSFTDTPRIPLGQIPTRFATGDFNADGRVDIAVGTYDGTSSQKGWVFTFIGRGDGTFAPPIESVIIGTPGEMTVADLDADGRDDIAVSASMLSIFRSQSDGLPFPPEYYGGGLPYFGSLLAVDANGDGRVDLVTVAGDVFEYPNTGPFPNRPPVSDAGRDQTLECEGHLAATALLDGSGSTDPDSTPGTNDNIANYMWSEGGASLATGETASVPFLLGAHDVTLTVTDKAGATGTDDTLITVQDTMPPLGSILLPANRACFGGAALPVTVTDNFADVCDPTVLRSYNPTPGPSYSVHGDYHVTLTAADTSGNAAMAAVDFTIDTKPPVVDLISPVDHALLAPSSLPFSILFRDSDDDGAAGGVVHEVIKLDGCPIFDGLTYGNNDGLLSDESIALGTGDLCRAAAACGFTVLNQPELRVEATDCGGNVGVAAHQFTGSLALRPGICGN